MKQVVGGAFSGFLNEQLEDEILDALIEASSQSADPGLGAAFTAALFEESLQLLMGKFKKYLEPRITIYLSSVTNRLLDPTVPLRWDFRTNNCQNFCDSLLSKELFLPLVAPTHTFDNCKRRINLEPLYLMSFVCRPGGYIKAMSRSKYDVPNGLTEEYLLKFRYGRHEESDILDTLMEYWYDWGNFGGPIYPYQDLFPWDCTEAYGRYPTRCGDCNLAKHVWAFPFDSWSVISLHLARGRHLYPPTEPGQAQHLSDVQWMRNRLTVLLAQDVLLAAAVAMAKSRGFHERTAWLHQPDHPDPPLSSQQQQQPHQANNAAAADNPKLDRLKLGGIHRAQPFSHHFEKGAYHLYFTAEWTHLRRSEQIAAYELLRDGRARMKDVDKEKEKGSDDDGSGCGGGGGCGGFGCGGVGGGCAGGCANGCGGGCGSGCSDGGCGTCGSGCGGCGGGCGG